MKYITSSEVYLLRYISFHLRALLFFNPLFFFLSNSFLAMTIVILNDSHDYNYRNVY